MFNFFNFKSKPIQDNQNLIAKTGMLLLSYEERKKYLLKIKRLLSVTDDIWENHYLYAIFRFCELVQDVPASELHHHNYNGGLIDHTLEALYLGIKASHGFILPSETNPESISVNADKWRFGVFIAILAHDIGKIVTDLEFVYKYEGKFIKWHPWNGNIPPGVEYTFRYKKRAANSVTAKSLHEKASMSLLPKLMTNEASLWLSSDAELLAQVISTISHSSFGGEVIFQITQLADMSSVSENMGGKGTSKNDFKTHKKPLHEKLLSSLIKLANDGALKRNRPGAALWITEKYTWVVSKAGMEAVREQLLEEGHKSIPKNVLRFFSALNENGLIIKTKNGDSVWKAEINDTKNNWKQKLTFLKFENTMLWPIKVPSLFDGEVIALDDEDIKKEQNKNTLITRVEEQKKLNNDSLTVQSNSISSNTNKKLQLNGEEPSRKEEELKVSEIEDTTIPSKPLDVDFFVWLINRMESKRFRYNEKNATVHFTKDYMVLVTPSIFLDYLKSNPMKRLMYTNKAGNKKPYTALQREVESLGIHKRSKNGTNIVNVAIKGVRRKSTFNGYALKRDRFPQLAHLSSNNAISIE